jgi:hypothetical protein
MAGLGQLRTMIILVDLSYMDDPTCIGCGEKYKTQKQLFTHTARCSKNKLLTVGDVFSKLERKRKLRARDKLCGANRACLLD